MTANKNYLLNDKFPKAIKNATSTSDGLMSSEDKARLDSIFDFGLLAKATADNDGLMGKEDKAKLDGIETGANYYVHPSSPDIQHVSSEQIDRWDANSSYTNETPVPVSIGGIKAGTTFNTMDYNTFFNKLLYPYLEPSISEITVIPSVRVYEKGSSFNLTRMSFNIQTPSLEDDKDLYYDFKLNDTHFHSLTTNNRSIDTTIVQGINKDSTLLVTVIDNINQEERSFELINYKFVYPFYYGVIDGSSIINETLVKSKMKLLEEPGDKFLNFSTNDEKMMFAYPKVYGELSGIYDKNGFNVLGTFERTEVTITAYDATNVIYYVYTNGMTTVSNYNMKFVF